MWNLFLSQLLNEVRAKHISPRLVGKSAYSFFVEDYLATIKQPKTKEVPCRTINVHLNVLVLYYPHR